jgi:hypothetical protein
MAIKRRLERARVALLKATEALEEFERQQLGELGLVDYAEEEEEEAAAAGEVRG